MWKPKAHLVSRENSNLPKMLNTPSTISAWHYSFHYTVLCSSNYFRRKKNSVCYCNLKIKWMLNLELIKRFLWKFVLLSVVIALKWRTFSQTFFWFAKICLHKKKIFVHSCHITWQWSIECYVRQSSVPVTCKCTFTDYADTERWYRLGGKSKSDYAIHHN